MRPTLIAGIANLAVIAVLALSACDNQQELCFDHNHDRVPVEVVFDWSECPDAEPKGMSLYLFGEGLSQPRRFDFSNINGGVIDILPGCYSVVALNSDIENTAVRYSSGIESFELRLRDSFTMRTGGVCNPSDMVWLGVIEDIDINEGLLHIVMREAICRCEVDVKKISNISCILSVDAILSGFNESRNALGRMSGSGSVSIGFGLERNDDVSLHAELLTLGHCGMVRMRGETDASTLHNISLTFLLNDGRTWSHIVDVTDQVHNYPADYCHIVIDSIAIPFDGTSTKGFDFIIDDWDTVNISIKP